MKIYGTFLQGHLKNFNEGVQEMATKILQAALALHDKVCVFTTCLCCIKLFDGLV